MRPIQWSPPKGSISHFINMDKIDEKLPNLRCYCLSCRSAGHCVMRHTRGTLRSKLALYCTWSLSFSGPPSPLHQSLRRVLEVPAPWNPTPNRQQSQLGKTSLRIRMLRFRRTDCITCICLLYITSWHWAERQWTRLGGLWFSTVIVVTIVDGKLSLDLRA